MILIFDGVERMVYRHHLWARKGIDLNNKVFPFKGHQYLLMLNRAFRVSWAPWPKVIYREKKYKVKGPDGKVKIVTKRKLDILATLDEIFRRKKVGLLLFQEPPPPREVKVPVAWKCKCGFVGKDSRGTKIHVSHATDRETHDLVVTEWATRIEGIVKEPIEPIHISRIHQPTGRLEVAR